MTASFLNTYVKVVSLTSAFLALLVIGMPILAPLFFPTYQVPEEIRNWGGLIIGFYFGSFSTLIGELAKQRSGSKDS